MEKTKESIKVNVKVEINLETFKRIQKGMGVSYSDLLKIIIQEGIKKYESKY